MLHRVTLSKHCFLFVSIFHFICSYKRPWHKLPLNDFEQFCYLRWHFTNDRHHTNITNKSRHNSVVYDILTLIYSFSILCRHSPEKPPDTYPYADTFFLTKLYKYISKVWLAAEEVWIIFVLSSVFWFYHKANSTSTRGSFPHTHLDRRAWMESMFQAPETG